MSETDTSPICILGAVQQQKLSRADLLAAWQEWRAAVRAHVIAKRDAGDPSDTLGLSLGSFTRVARTRKAWAKAMTLHRANLVPAS